MGVGVVDSLITSQLASANSFSRKQRKWVSMLAVWGLPLRFFVALKECG